MSISAFAGKVKGDQVEVILENEHGEVAKFLIPIPKGWL